MIKSDIQTKMKRVDIMIFSALIFGLVFTLAGCEKNASKEYTNRYVGQWKLMSINFDGDLSLIGFLNPPMVNYSETSIIYEFKRGGVMTVSGEAASLDLDWYAEHGLLDLYLDYEIEAGEHSYSSTFLVDNGWCAWDLKIGDKDSRLIVSEDKSKMTITKTISYTDLPSVISTRTSPAIVVLFVTELVKIEE